MSDFQLIHCCRKIQMFDLIKNLFWSSMVRRRKKIEQSRININKSNVLKTRWFKIKAETGWTRRQTTFHSISFNCFCCCLLKIEIAVPCFTALLVRLDRWMYDSQSSRLNDETENSKYQKSKENLWQRSSNDKICLRSVKTAWWHVCCD